jgi:hypothetical protein
MTTTSTTSLQSTTLKTITLELEARDLNRLRSEHGRLSYNAADNTMRPLEWDRFLETCITIGVERLQSIPADDALNLVGLLEAGQADLFHQIMPRLPISEKRAEAIELVDRLEG